MKQQYCDNELITFNLQGLLWIAKVNQINFRQQEIYALKLQYRTQGITVEFLNEDKRNIAYENARLLLIPHKDEI